MAGKKGSSPSVYKYYKVDGDKVTNTHKIARDVVKVFSCQYTKTE